MKQKKSVLEGVQELLNKDDARIKKLHIQKAEIEAEIGRLEERRGVIVSFREIVEAEPEPVSREGTITSQVTDLVEQILSIEGPIHRKELLARVRQQGIYFGSAEKDQLNTFASYLTVDDRFESIGRGVWRLAGPDQHAGAVEDDAEEDNDTSNEEGGVLLSLVK